MLDAIDDQTRLKNMKKQWAERYQQKKSLQVFKDKVWLLVKNSRQCIIKYKKKKGLKYAVSPCTFMFMNLLLYFLGLF